MTTLADLWPPAGLSLTCGDLVLTVPDTPTLVALGEVAGRGVHAEDTMPFLTPWTRGEPRDVARAVVTYNWGLHARMAPDDWSLTLAVSRRGVPVGMQGIQGKGFPVLREVESGSWLGREFQGQGIGLRMRLMILHLAFDGFGADRALTSAFADNAASNAVSRRLGYAPNGEHWLAREGVATKDLRYVLTREAWEHRPDEHRLDIRYAGLAAVRGFLQITDPRRPA